MSFVGNIWGPGDILGHVSGRIRKLEGIESCGPDKSGTIVAVANTGGIDRRLRQEVLALGMNAMMPVRVFYRMPDGRLIGEEDFSNEKYNCRHCSESATKKIICSRGFAPTCDEHEETITRSLSVQGYHVESVVNLEAIEDYYTRIYVNNFAGDKVEAPPEEVALEPEGAKKLQRVRGGSRGRPVVAWKYGDMEIRCGSTVKFKSDTCLNWKSGQTMNIKKGCVGHVYELSSKNPIAYLQVGEFSGVQLPIHAIGHLFDVMVSERKEEVPKKGTLDYQRLINTIGFGHDELPQHDTANNHPTRDRRRTKRVGAHQSSGVTTNEGRDKDEEDFLLPPDKNNPGRPEDPVFKGKGGGRKKIILQRR